MASAPGSEVKFEIGHVLFIDIVGYSKALINEQSELLQKLKAIVRATGAKNWSVERRNRTGHAEFLEWCEWLATQIAHYRATRPYVPAYSQVRGEAAS